MKRKVKIFGAISSLCLAVMLMAFGVYAAATTTYTVSGAVTYTAADVFAEIKGTWALGGSVAGTDKSVTGFSYGAAADLNGATYDEATAETAAKAVSETQNLGLLNTATAAKLSFTVTINNQLAGTEKVTITVATTATEVAITDVEEIVVAAADVATVTFDVYVYLTNMTLSLTDAADYSVVITLAYTAQ